MSKKALLYSLLTVPPLRSEQEEEQAFVETVKSLGRIQRVKKHGPDCMCLPVLTIPAHIPRRNG